MNEPPKHFAGHARAIWKELAPDLVKDGRLTAGTLPAFRMLCELWAMYQEGRANGLDANKVVALSKQVQNLFKDFHLTPNSARFAKEKEDKELPWLKG